MLEQMMIGYQRAYGVRRATIGSRAIDPRTNSPGLAAEIRSRGIPFVFATGYADAIQQGTEVGTNPVVIKPYGRSQLCEAIASVMRQAP